MINAERVHGLMLRWQAALNHRKYDSHWNPSQGMKCIIHLIQAFPETPALEVLDWVAGVIETGEGPMTFGDIADVSSPMELIRNDYRGFRMVLALCPIRC
jgi:hypothetical protein